MPSLPPDLLVDIANQLDVASAKSLARVSSHWQPAAESRIYRTIHISYADQLPGPTNPGPSPHTNTIATHHPGDIFHTYLDAIQARAWRRNQIREFTVELRRDIPASLGMLLREISGGLRILKMSFPPLLPGSIDDGLFPLAGLFAGVTGEERLRFPMLEELEMDVGPHWLDLVGSMVVHSPRLRKLSVRGNPPTLAKEDKVTLLPQAKEAVIAACEQIPDHLQLRELAVTNLAPGYEAVPLFETIVRNSPRLSVISVRDAGEDGDSVDRITGTLSECEAVTCLEIPSACLRAIHRLEPSFERHGAAGPFANVAHLGIAWEYSDLRACSSDLKSTLFPSLPMLQSCEFGLKSHNSNIPPYDIYRGHLYDLAIKAIRHQALYDGFNSTPKLEFIQLKEMYGPLLSGPDTAPATASSLRYMKAGEVVMTTSRHRSGQPPVDGAFITRYYKPDSVDYLIYIRHRTAHSCGWEEYAVYNGKEMGMPLVSGAMSVNDVGVGQRHVIQPGVGSLNEKAWEVLNIARCCREDCHQRLFVLRIDVYIHTTPKGTGKTT